MTNDNSPSPEFKQRRSEFKVPWLEYAKAERQRLGASPITEDLRGRVLTLSMAIDLAEADFKRARTVSRPANPVEGSQRRGKEKDEFDAEVATLRQRIEASLMVGATHALQQLLTKLRHDLAAEPTVIDIQKALCSNTEALPALVANDDPLAAKLDPKWKWVQRVSDTLDDWAERLGLAFIPKPWQGDGWNHAWSSAAALTELDRWLNIARSHLPGEDLGRWDRVITAMQRPGRPKSARYSTRGRGAMTCLPTDASKPYLVARLQVSPWLALTLDPDKAEWQVIPDEARSEVLWSRGFRVHGLGDMSRSEVFRSSALKVGHLYASIFIRQLDQRPGLAVSPSMKTRNLMPPAELPAELHELLDPGEWGASLMVFSIRRAKGLAAHRDHSTGQLVQMGKKVAPSKDSRLKTRLAPPTRPFKLPSLRPLPSEQLDWKPPTDPDSESLGTVRLSPVELDANQPPQYTDCTVLVKLRDHWYVVYPELWDVEDDEGDEGNERVHLYAYAPLHPALREAGGWPRLAQAMPQACWVGHFRGLGMLLLAALDLDSELP
jgi:hypothetical protein